MLLAGIDEVFPLLCPAAASRHGRKWGDRASVPTAKMVAALLALLVV